MNIRIVATSDREVYVGVNSDARYYVLSLDDASYHAELGDVLSGVFDDSAGLFHDVHDATQDRKIGICMEDWEGSLDRALDRLLEIGSPERVFAGSKSFPAGSDDVLGQLRREICGS